jgi:hypothetical protein
MGQFTSGEITASFTNGEVAEKVAEQIANLDNYLKSKGNVGDTNIKDIDVDANFVYVKLSSGRQLNAEWQLQQIFEMCKELFIDDMIDFDAEYAVPENLIYWSSEDK